MGTRACLWFRHYSRPQQPAPAIATRRAAGLGGTNGASPPRVSCHSPSRRGPRFNPPGAGRLIHAQVTRSGGPPPPRTQVAIAGRLAGGVRRVVSRRALQWRTSTGPLRAGRVRDSSRQTIARSSGPPPPRTPVAIAGRLAGPFVPVQGPGVRGDPSPRRPRQGGPQGANDSRELRSAPRARSRSPHRCRRDHPPAVPRQGGPQGATRSTRRQLTPSTPTHPCRVPSAGRPRGATHTACTSPGIIGARNQSGRPLGRPVVHVTSTHATPPAEPGSPHPAPFPDTPAARSASAAPHPGPRHSLPSAPASQRTG